MFVHLVNRWFLELEVGPEGWYTVCYNYRGAVGICVYFTVFITIIIDPVSSEITYTELLELLSIFADKQCLYTWNVSQTENWKQSENAKVCFLTIDLVEPSNRRNIYVANNRGTYTFIIIFFRFVSQSPKISQRCFFSVLNINIHNVSGILFIKPLFG